MAEWTVQGPQRLEFEESVHRLRLRVVAGDVTVTAGDGPARLDVHDIDGAPLTVRMIEGELTIGYDDLGWGGLLGGWRGHRRSVSLSLSVPPSCAVQLGVVSADALLAGFAAPAEVRSVSGEVTLDGVTADVTAQTVSGDVAAHALQGALRLETVSGGLTVVDGAGSSVRARSVSGEMTLDLQPSEAGDVTLESVSGDVVVRLPEETGASIAVQSMSGRLSSGFTGLQERRSPGSRRMDGRIGTGTGRVDVRTVSGDVAVLARTGTA